jgi:hypothetical protein
MPAKKILRYAARGLSIGCIAAIVYNLLCMRGI